MTTTVTDHLVALESMHALSGNAGDRRRLRRQIRASGRALRDLQGRYHTLLRRSRTARQLRGRGAVTRGTRGRRARL